MTTEQLNKLIDWEKVRELTGEWYWDWVDENCDQFNCDNHLTDFCERHKNNKELQEYIKHIKEQQWKE